MTSKVALRPDQAAIVACTISRDVQNFDLLIEDMEAELGEKWGDLTFRDALSFFGQPEAAGLEFVAVALDGEDEGELALVSDIIRTANEKKIKVILIAEDVGPAALHQLLRLGADDFCPYPLPEGALHEAIQRARSPVSARAAALSDDGAAPVPVVGGGNREGAVLAVHGLAGGVGATTFAVNLAWELASIGADNEKLKKKAPRVCLLDFGLQFGSVATYLDMARRESVYEMLSDTANLDADGFTTALQQFEERLNVLTAPADMLPLDIIAPKDVTAVIDIARRLFDFVIIDMPSTVVPWTETVLSAAHLYFCLLELDMRSAQNTLRLKRALQSEELPVDKLRYVLNRAPKFTDLNGKSRVKRLAESLDIAIELQLPDGGKQVMQAGDHGLPLASAAAKNPLRREIAKLAASLHEIGQDAAEAA